MMRDDFCCFILSHGRPDRIHTLRTLQRQGYTGKWYVVIDNEDEMENEYRRLYGDKVLQFNKIEIAKTFDTGDTQNDRRTIVYARNACFDLAKQVGCRYFLELDDDYTFFSYRMVTESGAFHNTHCRQLDRLFSAMLDYFEKIPAKSIALAQGGDFIGGQNSSCFKRGTKRKCMNSFFCDTERPFKFLGRINEDVNTYTSAATRGDLFLTIMGAGLNQMATQTNKGGMSDVYLDRGTYLKSFYSVMMCPSAVRISTMGGAGNGICHRRIHHKVCWRNCTPQILSPEHKK